MIITKIERQKRNPQRVNLFVDDSFLFGMHDEVLVKFGLRKGDSIDQQTIDEIESVEEFNLAKQKALRLISYRIRSEKELEAKLREKEFHPKTIERVTEHLRSLRILDDKTFARSYVNSVLIRKPAGRALLQRELKSRGIESTTINEILQETLRENDEQHLAIEAARKLLLRYRSSRKQSEKEQQQKRIANFLARRGFGWSTIQPVIRKLFNDTSSTTNQD
jgi:regulatory protein